MEFEGVIVPKEVTYQNGHTGVEYSRGFELDEVRVQFSARELAVLEAVAKAFRGKPPSKIRDLSHKESAYRESRDRARISYEHASDLSLPVPE